MTYRELLPLEFQIIAAAFLASLLGWVLRLIRRHSLSLRDSFLWLLSTMVALLFTAFPRLLQGLATAAGIRTASNALFVLAFVYVVVNLLSVTIATSRNATEVRRLAQERAILKAQVDRLQSMLGSTDERVPR